MEREWGSNYWQMTSWEERIRQIYRSKDFSDFTFIVENEGESISFPAHKSILGMSSPMFEEMFKTPRSAATSRTVLRNIQPDMVEIMLDHIYNQTKVDFISLQQCFGILKLATQYELSTLRRMCTSYIEQFINVTEVCTVYETAVSVGNKNLALKCFQFIQMKTKDIVREASWRNALPITVEAIVKQERLNISEEELFQAIVRWANCRAEAKEAVRRLVEPFLPHIRFIHMSLDTFLKVAADTDVFRDDEVGSISLKLFKRDSRSLPPWFSRNTNRRSYEHRTTADDSFLYDWFNINREVYSHSEYVKRICCSFKARSSEFLIHQLHIGICDDCLAVNRRKKEKVILKVTVGADTPPWSFLTVVHETTVTLPTEKLAAVQKPATQKPNFDKRGSVLMVRSLSDPSAFGANACIRWEEQPPLVQTVLYPFCPVMMCVEEGSGCKEIEPPHASSRRILAEPFNFRLDQPLSVQSEQRFTISIETENNERFFCCKKKPSFDGAPFAGCPTEGDPEVWCALEKITYSKSRPDSDSDLYD